MKKFILKILLFFAIVGICDVCMGFTIDYLTTNAKGGITKQMNDLCYRNNYDVLILGSSQAHHHYVPDILSDSLNMSVYNAGSDGNGIIYAYGIYKVITGRYTPKVIIYNVTPAFDIIEYKNDDNNMRYLQGLKPFYENPDVKEIFLDVRNTEVLKNYSLLYRNNSTFLNPIKNYIIANNDTSNGYEPLYGEISKEYNKNTDDLIYALDSLKLKYVRKFIQSVKNKGIKLFFISSPKYGVTNSEIFNTVKEICKEEGIIYLDYYKDKRYINNRTIFKEPMHLNDMGAKLFTIDIFNNIKKYINYKGDKLQSIFKP